MLFTPTTELLIDGDWVDITADTFQGEGLTILRGLADEATTADPSSCNLSINNRSGDYAPRNPTGAYFGRIGRNTPLRVRRPTALQNYLSLPGSTRNVDGTIATSSYALTADAASLDITGDIDIRIDIEPCTWRPEGVFVTSGTTTDDGYGLAQKSSGPLGIPGSQISWRLYLVPGGFLVFQWSSDGFALNTQAVSTVAVPSTPGRLALRVTLDVNNGAAGRDIRFYTSPTIGGTWTQLGATITQAGTTSIFSGSAEVRVGSCVISGSSDIGLQGKVYGFELRNGLAGTVVTSPDFTAQDSATTAFVDAQARSWSISGSGIMANPGARFHGETGSWPARWDKTGRHRRAPVTAYGILSRLNKPRSPVRSVMHRWLTADTTQGVVAYWPCEDGSDAEEFASALPGAPAMLHPSGPTNNASFDGFKASDPLPTASLVQWTGAVPSYTETGSTQVRFLVSVPAGGVASTAELFRIRASGGTGSANAVRWSLNLGTGGSLQMIVYNSDDTLLVDSGFQATNLNGKRVLISIDIDDSGADISATTRVYHVGVAGVQSQFVSFMSNRAFGRVQRVAVNVNKVMDDVAVGHISVQTAFTGWTSGEDDRLVAHKGELAPDRVLRLCREENVPVVIDGDSNQGARLGPQLSGALVDLLREAAEADLGILHEARECLALKYRTRVSLYSQDPTLTLDYEAGSVFDIEPVEDDDATRNDITVTQTTFGGSARAVDETSRMSILEPPNGVGPYVEESPISLSRGDDLPNQASWRLHLGTVDEERYPKIGMTLGHSSFTADPTLLTAAVALEIGDRFVIENPPEGVGAPEDIQQIVRGFTETFTGAEWLLDMNCTPASPWNVGVWDQASGPGEARYSSLGTFLMADVPKSGCALVLNGVSPGRASAPDSAAFDILGDLDIRVHVAMDDWSPATIQTLLSKFTATGNQRSWSLSVNTTGNLVFVWSANGTATNTAPSTANLAGTANGAALWVRATIDVDNGASGRTVTFYTSTDGDTWTILGTAVTTATVTSIFNSSAPVLVGSIDVGTNQRLAGKVSAVEIRNGILGTRVARPEFGAQAADTTSFVDAQGNTWTITTPGAIADVSSSLFPSALFVSTPTGPNWSALDAPYDMMLGGERVRLTALTGAGTDQVLTVTRAVNGVRKGHTTGAEVALFKPAVYAL